MSAELRRIAIPLGLFIWLAATAGVRPLALPDEGRYVGVALEMAWSGDWLMPRLDTLPYFHKPPLFYWLAGASLAAFGVNEWAARLPSVLAAAGAAYALYLFVRRWVGETQGHLTLLVLATTPFFFGGAQFANLDMLVAACIAGTVLCAAQAALTARDGRPDHRILAGAYALAGLGVLAKGLIGVVIPALVIATWLVVCGRASMILRMVWLPGLALFSAIAVPWFALMETRHPGFLHYFFVHHHLERYTSDQFNGHAPFWFYVPVFAGATLPWFIFLVSSARKRGAVGWPAWQVHALMWVWLVTTIVFFSIPSSKLVGYVLPAVPPFAVLAADGLLDFVQLRNGRRRWVAGVVATAFLLCPTLVFVARAFQRDNIPDLATHIRSAPASVGNTVVALRNYPFNLAFELGHPIPIRVVDDWDDPRILKRDNWRRELQEAAQFDPSRGRLVLLKREGLERLIACSEQRLWVIAPATAASELAKFMRLQQIAVVGSDILFGTAGTGFGDKMPDCGP